MCCNELAKEMPASAVRQFWAQGMTPEQLAEAFNVSQRSMDLRIAKLGLR